jgi:hypothetical protein
MFRRPQDPAAHLPDEPEIFLCQYMKHEEDSVDTEAQPRRQAIAVIVIGNRLLLSLWLMMLSALSLTISLALSGGVAHAAGPATGPWTPGEDDFCDNGKTVVTIGAYVRNPGSSNPPVERFRFIVNEDVANDPAWSGNPRSYSPLVALGDDSNATVCLPSGKYLVSVMGGPFPPAPGGYKMSGTHFTVPDDINVDVGLVPGPLPLSSINVVVHHDNLMVNGALDIPVEQGLKDFAILLEDGTGEVSVDFYGNPICTEYQYRSAHILLIQSVLL